MVVRIKAVRNTNQMLDVSSNFATLLDIEPDGTFVYEFEYRAATFEFLRNSENSRSVEILVHKEQPGIVKPIVRNAISPTKIGRLVRGIVRSGPDSRDASRQFSASVIKRTESDLTSKLNKGTNAILGSRSTVLKNIAPLVKVISARAVSDLKKQNIEPAVLQVTPTTNTADSTQRDSRAASTDLLYRGFDPTSLFSRFFRANGTFSSFSGLNSFSIPIWGVGSTTQGALTRRQKDVQNSFLGISQRQLNFKSDLYPSAVVPVISATQSRFLRYEKLLRIPSSQVGSEDFYVEFRLKGDDGRIKERVVKRVAHRTLVRLFSTPREAPEINVAPFQFPGRNVLEIKQVDERANAVRIFKRAHTRVDLDPINNEYQQIAELPLRKEDGVVKFVDVTNNFSRIQYRVIAVGATGLLSSAFNNVVSSPARVSNSEEVFKRPRGASIFVENVPGGINIDVSNVATGVISVAVIKRNLSKNEKKFNKLDVEFPVTLVTNGLGDVNFLDEDVKENDIYEYGLVLYYDDGSELIASDFSQIKFKSSKVGLADIVVEGPVIEERGLSVNVTFNVSSVLNETNLDSVKTALEKQGLLSLFEPEVLNERDRLQQLIAHSITRTDMTTGRADYFGTFTGEKFSDIDESTKASAQPLIPGHKYRYVINTLLRAPETLFDNFEKQVRDDATGKMYSFKPAKWRHPLTLETGTVVTRESLDSNHPEDDFAFGIVGNSRTFEVDIPLPDVRIRDINVNRLDKRNVRLRWTVDGPKRNVEHYIILKDMLGMISIAGKTHHVSSTSTFEFYDRLTPDDIGEIKYRVVPVLNNFEKAQESIFVSLRVDDGRI